MPVQKKQLQRLIKFIALMKKGKYPNARSFYETLRQADLYDNENVACSMKTIYRDIELLKNDYNAPINFDRQQNGYYLTRSSWEFSFPVLRDETVLASILGSKLAQDLMPEPVKSEISDAVDRELTTNTIDLLDTAFIDSLIAASGVKVRISPQVFKTVFDAWRQREALNIKYCDRNGRETERCIEPHVLTYYCENWYIKGFCLERNDVRFFAVHRITEATPSGKYFEPDQLLIHETGKNRVFIYQNQVKNIEIACSAEIAGYINEQYEYYNETITEQPDGSVIVSIPEAPEHEIIKWVLAEGGNAKVLKPASLAMKIVKAAEKVAKVNTGVR